MVVFIVLEAVLSGKLESRKDKDEYIKYLFISKKLYHYVKPLYFILLMTAITIIFCFNDLKNISPFVLRFYTGYILLRLAIFNNIRNIARGQSIAYLSKDVFPDNILLKMPALVPVIYLISLILGLDCLGLWTIIME